MKITISVGGRFHAFYLAHQLQKHGHLQRLITSYPKFETVKYGIPREKLKSILIKEILERGWGKLPHFYHELFNPSFFINELYDRLASKKIPQSDIFIGWAAQSLHSLRYAKKKGALTILERGSSHMLYQLKLLKEEYENFGMKDMLKKTIHPKLIEKQLKEYEETDYIEIPSSFVLRSFLHYGFPKEKLILGGRGVDLKSFSPISKKDDVFRVVFSGSMTLQKGVHYLLQAFTELKLSNAELLLIGALNEEIKPFFKKYNGNFKWIGHVPQSELYKHYSQGSVFVMPSIQEGLAVVQLQAMACGLPLIGTTNTGAEDFVREGIDGFIVPIRKVDALKEKILYLYDNPDICKKMGRSAKERVSSGFTWDDYGEKIIAEYQKILKEKH